jgi:hypothetical protein
MHNPPNTCQRAHTQLFSAARTEPCLDGHTNQAPNPIVRVGSAFYRSWSRSSIQVEEGLSLSRAD